ncbi:alkaline phosphatase [Chytridium lagenaria]|nr:alkaline phosphatase [Chytridium lagenaria]
MISDGFGPASQTLARNFYTHVYNETYDHQLALDKILVGSSRTRSSSSLVTDSAAGATAFACSIKTYNGAIGMTPVQKPCGTVLEAAKSKGYLTGLVATSRITHGPIPVTVFLKLL